jgi:hypothetical protein
MGYGLMSWTLGILALMIMASSARGEVVVEPDSAEVMDSALVPADSIAIDSGMADSALHVDTILFAPGTVLTTYGSVSDSLDREKRLRQKPMWALFKSMVVPGWGQIGNGRYIKAAVYFGLEAWMVGGAIHYGQQASDFRRLFDETPRDAVSLRNDYYSLYRDRQDECNKYTWFAVIVAFVSMFDAYVDAHLSGFPRQGEGNDLTLQVAPTEENGVTAALSLRF